MFCVVVVVVVVVGECVLVLYRIKLGWAGLGCLLAF